MLCYGALRPTFDLYETRVEIAGYVLGNRNSKANEALENRPLW